MTDGKQKRDFFLHGGAVMMIGGESERSNKREGQKTRSTRPLNRIETNTVPSV
jgi:hypothetical protein